MVVRKGIMHMLDTPGPNQEYMAALRARYDALRAEGLNLDLTRGVPSAEQLALADPMLAITETNINGIDCRNYGGVEGLPLARKLCASYLGTKMENTLVVGNSSLELMHNVIVQKLLRSTVKSIASPAFICSVPGYDRHFKICEQYGIRTIPVPLLEDGPDMDIVEKLVREDASIIGIWCNPKYSNPTGITYSRKTTRRLVSMKTKYPGFFIMWDDAYRHHDWGTPTPVPDIMALAREKRTEDRVWIFGSFSKVTHAGSALAMMASSKRNIEWFLQSLSTQTIGPDKLLQLRHLLFLKNLSGIKKHLLKHRKIVKPKLNAMLEVFEKQLGNKGMVTWTKPDGGYFISMTLSHGSAKRVVELASGVGLKLTPAGAAFPHGNDPQDNHLRVSFTSPPLKVAPRNAEVLCLCIEIAHREAHPQTRVQKP